MGNSAYAKAASLKLDDLAPPDDNTDLDSSTAKHGLLPKRDGDVEHFLDGDGSWVHAPGTSYDLCYFRRAGNDAWYSTHRNCWASTSTGPHGNRIWAVPFIVPKTITLDRIAVYCATLGTVPDNEIELGIYNNGNNMYPGSLLLDAGHVVLSATGIRSIEINQQLIAGNLYWLVELLRDDHSGTCYLNYGNWSWPILGWDIVNAPAGKWASIGWTVAQAYGAYPDPFPAGGEFIYQGGSESLYLHTAVYVRLSVA